MKTSMKNKIQTILANINEGAFERQEAIALSLLGALSGESVFLLGLPGVGKSMIARKLKQAFKEASVFEYLMSRFSTPDEIFGPVSISALKDHDSYERMTQGYLPEADIVFLDEIWKAGPAIQNTLLTVLNEKTFLNGNREMKLPLKAIIAASNELPAEGEGLEALWDRFLIRYIVEPIRKRENFFKLLKEIPTEKERIEQTALSFSDYQFIRERSKTVEVPEGILKMLFSLREKLDLANGEETQEEEKRSNSFYISDRRWRKAIGVMKTSALINGRKSVDFSDSLLLTHMLWNDDTCIKKVHHLLAESLIAALYEDIMSRYSGKAQEERDSSEPFSPDGKHYVVICDDFTLKISIKDYNHLRRHRGEHFFGSESKDGKIVLKEMGQFSIKYVKEGAVCINNYSYSLQTQNDLSMRRWGGQDLISGADNIMRQFEKMVRDNIFLLNPPVLYQIAQTSKMYRQKFAEL